MSNREDSPIKHGTTQIEEEKVPATEDNHHDLTNSSKENVDDICVLRIRRRKMGAARLFNNLPMTMHTRLRPSPSQPAFHLKNTPSPFKMMACVSGLHVELHDVILAKGRHVCLRNIAIGSHNGEMQNGIGVPGNEVVWHAAVSMKAKSRARSRSEKCDAKT